MLFATLYDDICVKRYWKFCHHCTYWWSVIWPSLSPCTIINRIFITYCTYWWLSAARCMGIFRHSDYEAWICMCPGTQTLNFEKKCTPFNDLLALCRWLKSLLEMEDMGYLLLFTAYLNLSLWSEGQPHTRHVEVGGHRKQFNSIQKHFIAIQNIYITVISR